MYNKLGQIRNISSPKRKERMKLKRIICLFMMFFLLCPLYAFADDSGVLAEGELNEWVVKVLRDSGGGGIPHGGRLRLYL